MSHVTPIFKNGNSQSVENCHPIAPTSYFYKVFEYAMLDCSSDYLKEHQMIKREFTAVQSTFTVLHALVERFIDCILFKELPLEFLMISAEIGRVWIRGLVLNWSI